MSRCVCKLPDHNDILVSKDDDYLTKQAKSLRSRESAEAKVGFQAVKRTFKTNGLISRSYSLDAMPDNDIRSGPRLSPRQLSLTMESQEPTRIVIEQEKDWIRVRQNLKSVVDSLVDEQLNQAGRNENLELRKQVTRRIQKVCLTCVSSPALVSSNVDRDS